MCVCACLLCCVCLQVHASVFSSLPIEHVLTKIIFENNKDITGEQGLSSAFPRVCCPVAYVVHISRMYRSVSGVTIIISSWNPRCQKDEA